MRYGNTNSHTWRIEDDDYLKNCKIIKKDLVKKLLLYSCIIKGSHDAQTVNYDDVLIIYMAHSNVFPYN